MNDTNQSHNRTGPMTTEHYYPTTSAAGQRVIYQRPAVMSAP
jgi:hypothetical protein